MHEFGAAEERALLKILRTKKLFRYGKTDGSACDEFERRFARVIGARNALLVTSGTNAIVCALAALGIGPGDEVLVPCYTFIATPAAVLAAGAIPIMVNVDETLTIDPNDLEKRINSRTKAIIPVHMDGQPADMPRILRIARRHKLRVIEDVAQAIGGSIKGRRLGSLADVGCFSFNQFKILTSGEGGALVTSHRDVYERAVIYHDMGAGFRAHAGSFRAPVIVGASMRVSEITGALLGAQLSRLDAILKRLRERKGILAEALTDVGASLRPSHSPRGECALSLILETQDLGQSLQLVDRLARAGIESQAALLWKNYFMKDWIPILQQRAGHHPRLNPYKLAGRKYVYKLAHYSRSVDLLARSIRIPIDASLSLAETRARARKIARLL